MSWELFNPFQRLFCCISVLILISQGAVIYTQHYNKKEISFSCPKIPPQPRPRKVDLSGLKKISLKIDAVLKSNKNLSRILKDQKKLDRITKDHKKLDKIIKNQWKVDRIIQRLDTWGVEK